MSESAAGHIGWGIYGGYLAWFLLIAGGGMILFGSTPGYAESETGTWVEARFNITMILSGDGTYSLQYSNGRSAGRYQTQPGVLCLRDFSGTPPVCYAVLSFSGNDLTLRDGQNVVMHFQRQAASVSPAPQTPSVTRGSRNMDDAPLAVRGGRTLRQSHLESGLFLVRFIIGGNIKSQEVEELRKKLIEEFTQAPDEAIRQLESIGGSMATVRKATDPLLIGLARQELFAALYNATRMMPEEQKPMAVRVINRYINVLAIDPVSGLLLTDRDVDGMIEWLRLNSEMMGTPVQLSPASRQTMIAEIVRAFPAMTEAQKKMIGSASLIWRVLDANWKKMTPAQKQQFQSRFAGRGAASAPAAAAPSPSQNQGTARQMADMQSRQNMFRIMNQMNLDSHALSLNIIENIGGTGNYWKVTDY